MSDVKNSSLATSLVSYWELEESTASSTWVDSHGSNDLSNNSSGSGVTSATGIQGNAADLEYDNGEYLDIAHGSQTGLAVSGDFSVSFWCKFETVPPSDSYTYFPVSKSSGLGTRGYAVQLRNDGGQQKVRLIISDDGSAISTSDVNQTLSVSTWYHYVVTYDASAGTGTVYRNGSSLGTFSGLDTSIYNSGGSFHLGGWQGTGIFDGVLDEVGFWGGRILSGSDVSTLYNSGSGIPYDAGGGASVNSNFLSFM